MKTISEKLITNETHVPKTYQEWIYYYSKVIWVGKMQTIVIICINAEKQ